MRHVSELLVPSFGRPVLLCRGKMPRARGMGAYGRDGFGAYRQLKFECGCCKIMIFRVCGVIEDPRPYAHVQSLSVHSLCLSILYVYTVQSDLDDRIFYCLLASNAAVQAKHVRASFLFVGDLNGHHQEWLGSTTTNPHGVAAFDFATVSGCDQLVAGPTHAHGGTLYLLMTDVPDLVRAAVVAPICNSDHSSLSAVISMAKAVPNLRVSRKVFLKHQVNSNTVCGAIRNCLGITYGFLTILLRFRTKIFPSWLDVMYQPRSSVCETRISLGLMINAGMLLASNRKLIFGGPVIAHELTGKSLSTVK